MNLLQEGYTLKTQIDALEKRLREVNLEIAKQAQFKEGSKTGHIEDGRIKVKVSLRENVKWDQEKLATVSIHFNHFQDAFKPEYKPRSSEALKIAMVNPEFAQAVEWARTITQGSPQVTYELIEEVENAA